MKTKRKKIMKMLIDREMSKQALAAALGISRERLAMALTGYRDTDPYREILRRAEGYLKSL